jgi:hypothetical protein
MGMTFGVLNYGAHHNQLRRELHAEAFLMHIHEDLLGSKQEQRCDTHPFPAFTPLCCFDAVP